MLNDPAVMTTVRRSREEACTVRVHAKLVSLNGGVVLAVCIILTAVFAATYLTARLAAVQSALITVLMVAAWVYLVDSVSESLSLVGRTIQRSSSFSPRTVIKLDDIKSLLLVHEGLNQEVGIESITATYRNGRFERLSLGPCWRRRDLESFLQSVEQAMGNGKLLEEVR